jgi:hypothetical protein
MVSTGDILGISYLLSDMTAINSSKNILQTVKILDGIIPNKTVSTTA